jgi:hypothetical protein
LTGTFAGAFVLDTNAHELSDGPSAVLEDTSLLLADEEAEAASESTVFFEEEAVEDSGTATPVDEEAVEDSGAAKTADEPTILTNMINANDFFIILFSLEMPF